MKCRVIFAVIFLFLLYQKPAVAVTIPDVTFHTKNAGKVVFSHKEHLSRGYLSKNCRACHDTVYNLKNKKHYTMAAMAKGKSCGACHDGKKAFAVGDCARCHQTREIVFRVPATGPVNFSHKGHLSMSSDCTLCHPTLFAAGHNKRVTMAQMKKGKSCGACHNGTKAFGLNTCTTCHPVKEITFNVKETGPTHFSHTSHLEVADCSACHPKLYAPTQKNKRVDMSGMGKGKSCGACHNSKTAFSVKECSKCHPVQELQFEEKSTGNVAFSHKSHIDLYSCGDCHRSLYQTARSSKKVTMLQMEAGKSCGGCHDGKTAFSVKDKCEACHKM